jgi:hypothetical protein
MRTAGALPDGATASQWAFRARWYALKLTSPIAIIHSFLENWESTASSMIHDLYLPHLTPLISELTTVPIDAPNKRGY